MSTCRIKLVGLEFKNILVHTMISVPCDLISLFQSFYRIYKDILMNCTVHHTRLVPEGARLERQVHLRHSWAQNKAACRFHQNRLKTIRQRHPAGVVVQAMSAGASARQS